jgi:ring-1,2-phenylacetyl-CoA epoxidase subunit PaaA
MRLAVFHYPFTGWADAVVMNVLQGAAAVIQVQEFARMSYQPLAEVFRAILPIEARHAELGREGLAQIMATDPDGVRASVAYWHPRVGLGFGAKDSQRFALHQRLGLRHRANDALLAEWQATVAAHLSEHGLKVD